jgi:hypothetical protein
MSRANCFRCGALSPTDGPRTIIGLQEREVLEMLEVLDRRCVS